MLKPVTLEVLKKYLNYIEPEDIYDLEKYLTPNQLYRIRVYESKMWDKLTSKRLFLFICNLIDFSILNSKKTKNTKKTKK